MLNAKSTIYPDTYIDKMTVDQQAELMEWFAAKNRIHQRGETAQLSHSSEVIVYGEHLCKRTQREIDTAIEILETIGIYVGYSWIGHRGEYFLITAEDAANQAEYLYNLEEKEA